jgi:hypothetical protein
MADVPGKPLAWRKSTFSSDSANCVEFAILPDSHGIGIRDSKDPDGPRLWFGVESWCDFVATVRSGEMDPPVSPV